MEGKNVLKTIKSLDDEINIKNQYLNELKSILTSVHSVKYYQHKIPRKRYFDYTNLVDQIFDLEAELDRLIDLFIDRKTFVLSKISEMENLLFQNILRKKYIEYKSLKRISCELHYSYSYIKHAHIDAVWEFQTNLNKHLIAP